MTTTYEKTQKLYRALSDSLKKLEAIGDVDDKEAHKKWDEAIKILESPLREKEETE